MKLQAIFFSPKFLLLLCLVMIDTIQGADAIDDNSHISRDFTRRSTKNRRPINRERREPFDIMKPAASHHHHHKKGAKGWLDMGAWTKKKGAFGWYADYPVGKGRR